MGKGPCITTHGKEGEDRAGASSIIGHALSMDDRKRKGMARQDHDMHSKGRALGMAMTRTRRNGKKRKGRRGPHRTGQGEGKAWH